MTLLFITFAIDIDMRYFTHAICIQTVKSFPYCQLMGELGVFYSGMIESWLPWPTATWVNTVVVWIDIGRFICNFIWSRNCKKCASAYGLLVYKIGSQSCQIILNIVCTIFLSLFDVQNALHTSKEHLIDLEIPIGFNRNLPMYTEKKQDWPSALCGFIGNW